MPEPSGPISPREGIISLLESEGGAPEGYDPALFAVMDAHERFHFWYEHRRRVLAWVLEQHFGRGALGIDCGAGTGNIAAHLREEGFPVEVAEVDAGAAHHALAKGFERVYRMDLYRVPFRARFDWAGLFDVLEHLDDDLKALRNVAGMLRRGGGVVITVPAHPALWSRFDEVAWHRRRYTEQSLGALLERAGFDVAYMNNLFSFLYVPMWLRARFSPVRAEATDASEFTEAVRISLANAAARAVARGEEALLRAGVTLPPGGSILAVGRKRAVRGEAA